MTDRYDTAIQPCVIRNRDDAATAIRAAMVRQRITRARLSYLLGSSRAYVSKVLLDGANFTVDSLIKISDALNCDLEIRLTPRYAPTAERGLVATEITYAD